MNKVSVIIPVHNVEEYLKRCIESVLNQTYKNIEIILIDDGSTDGSSRICDDYSKKDGRVKVHHKKNEGVSSARNRGIQLAHGEYFTFVDADDFIDADMVEYLLSMSRENNADMSTCQYRDIRTTTDSNFKIKTKKVSPAILDKKRALKEILYQKSIQNGPCGKLYKAYLLNTVLFSEDISIGEDLEFNIKCLNLANKIVVSMEPKYNYFYRKDSAIHSSFTHNKMDVLSVTSKVISDMENQQPSLRKAAIRKQFKVAVNLIFSMQNTNDNEDFQICSKIIKKHAPIVLIDSNNSYRDRAYALTSIVSVNLLFWLFHFKQNVKHIMKLAT